MWFVVQNHEHLTAASPQRNTWVWFFLHGVMGWAEWHVCCWVTCEQRETRVCLRAANTFALGMWMLGRLG